MRKKLYFCFPISGPNNGVKIISNYIVDFLAKRSKYDLELVDIAQAKEHSNFGNFSLAKFIDTFRLFKRLLSVSKKDLVYLNLTPKGFAFYRDMIFLMICKFKRSNVTIHIHANGLEKKINFLTGIILKGVKIIVINTDQLNKIQKKHQEVFLIKNALPDYYNNALEPKFNNKIRLLFFSNLSKEKGLFRLIDVARKIDESNISCELNICGGILNSDFKSIIDKLVFTYNFVKYHGSITDEKEKFLFFSESDFLLFLSDINYEVSPLVYIEALMSGLPIISTEQIVSPDIVNSGNMFILREDLGKIVSILSNYNKSFNELSQLKKKSRNYYLKEYSFENFVYEIENVLKK